MRKSKVEFKVVDKSPTPVAVITPKGEFFLMGERVKADRAMIELFMENLREDYVVYTSPK